MEILRWLRCTALSVVLLAVCVASSLGPRTDEDHVKAAFLFNFLKFVEWPPPGGNSPWIIGVVGDADFAAVLETTVHGKTVDGRPVAVKRLARANDDGLADARGCNIVFFAAPASPVIPVLPGVLTVGDGAILNFYLEDDQVRFEVRLQAAKAANLHISSQLLRLARIK